MNFLLWVTDIILVIVLAALIIDTWIIDAQRKREQESRKFVEDAFKNSDS